MTSAAPLAGRRIVMFVYNDLASDARVIKEATTLSDAGAEVRVIALAVAKGRFVAGLDHSRSAFETLRLPIVEIRHLLPRWGNRVRRLVRRGGPDVGSSEVGAATLSPRAASLSSESMVSAPTAFTAPRPSGAKALVIDLWRRLDLTLRMASYWQRASRAAADWRPDAVHSHDANTLPPAVRVARRLRIPLVYDSHELWTHRNVSADRPVAKRFERIIERRGIRHAAVVVTVSPSIARWLQEHYQLATAPLLVRNIPASSPTAGVRSEGRLRALTGLPDSARVLVYCGGVTTNRGIERVVDVLAELDASHHLVAVGPTSDVMGAELQRRAASAGTQDRLHLIGAVDANDVTTALSDGDVSFVLTHPSCLSYRYSLPNKLFESLHAGVPVIANDLPDTGDVIREYAAGVVIPVDASASALAAAVIETIVRRDELSRAARAAARHLRWEDDMGALVSAYGAAMARTPAEERRK